MNPAAKLSVVLVLAVTSLCAQQSAGSPAPVPERPAVRPATLTFTVEVTDKAGHPVSGLKESDFTLLDNKSPSPIQGFTAHTPGPNSPESVVLAFDLVNMGFGGASIARTQIMDLLRKDEGRLPYPVTLLLITDTGITQLGKTSDEPGALLAALNTQQGQLRDVGRSGGFWGAAEREATSVNSLSLMARAMARVPGRKLLVWLGPGWPIFDSPTITYTDGQLHRIFAEAVSLSNAMTEAQVTLYDVDPLGSWDAGQFRTFLWESYTRPLRRWDKSQPGDLALQVLAVQSGGLVLNSNNDVAGEVNTCTRDGSAWYTITFTPQASEKPDTWHSVEIKLAHAGLTVRTRTGYYAQP